MLADKLRTVSSSAARIQFVGRTTAEITGTTATPTNVSLTSLTGGLAAAPVAGDLVIVYYGTGSIVNQTIGVDTTGYTEVAELYSNDTYDANLSVSYKVMGATPDTQVQVSATGSVDESGAVAIHVWRGVDPILPLDVVSTTTTGGNTALLNPPAITPVTAGAVIVSGGAAGHIAGVQTYSSSDLSNFATIGGPEDTYDVTVGIGSAVWTSGAFNPVAFTFSGTDNDYAWAAVTMALRPNQNQVGPILISQASTSGSTSSVLTINKPTGTLEGDLMVAVMNHDSARTFTGDTGWTEVADQGAGASTRIAYKVAGASEGASYAFTASADGQSSGTIATYRNAAYDAVGTITSGTDPLVLSSVTASVAFSRILATVARSSASITITGPATMRTIAIDNDAASPSRLVEQDATLLSAAGASGTRSFTMGSTTNVSGALVAIKPAASYTKYAQYIAGTSTIASGSSTLVNTPACVPGNLLLFVVCPVSLGVNITVTTPSGWTLLSGNGTGTNTSQPGMYVFYRVADGSEAASYSATISASTSSVSTIVSLAGVDPTTLTAGTTNTGASTTSITATEVTATANGILLYFGSQANNNQGPVTFTPPSGMTEALERSFNGSTNDSTLEVAYQEGLSAGATGSKTGTASAATGTNRFRAILVTVDAI